MTPLLQGPSEGLPAKRANAPLRSFKRVLDFYIGSLEERIFLFQGFKAFTDCLEIRCRLFDLIRSMGGLEIAGLFRNSRQWPSSESLYPTYLLSSLHYGLRTFLERSLDYTRQYGLEFADHLLRHLPHHSVFQLPH